MVYESDFYTTRRPYTTRMYPSVTSYSYNQYEPISSTTATTTKVIRQIRILPSISKVHVFQTTSPSTLLSTSLLPVSYSNSGTRTTYMIPASTYHIIRVRPSIINRELNRIEHKKRPMISISPTYHYLNSDPIANFQTEASTIRSQTASLLRQIYTPVPRVHAYKLWPVKCIPSYYDHLNNPERFQNHTYIYKMLTPIRHVKHYDNIYKPVIHITLPRSIGNAHHFAALNFVGDKVHLRRHPLLSSDLLNNFENTVRNDVNLLSYYIRPIEGIDSEGNLSPTRPTRHFTNAKEFELGDPNDEINERKKERAARMARVNDIDSNSTTEDRKMIKAERPKLSLENRKPSKEETIDEKPEEVVTNQEAEEIVSDLDKKTTEEETEPEPTVEAVEETANKVQDKPIKKKKRQESSTAVSNDEKQMSPKKQSLKSEINVPDKKEIERLEQIAKEAEADKEAELARQAEELAELARQEAELAELERQERELAEMEEKMRREKEENEKAAKAKKDAEKAKKEAEQAEKEAELKRQEEELAELKRQEEELAELERQEQELARQEAELNKTGSGADKELEAISNEQIEKLQNKQTNDENDKNMSENLEEIKGEDGNGGMEVDKDGQLKDFENDEELLQKYEEEVINGELGAGNAATGDAEDPDSEAIEREQAEIVALARRAVQLAALDAEAKALDASDKLPNDTNDCDNNNNECSKASDDYATDEEPIVEEPTDACAKKNFAIDGNTPMAVDGELASDDGE